MANKEILKFRNNPILIGLLSLDDASKASTLTDEEVQFWYIEAYLQNKLSQSDRYAFDKLLASDAAFRQSVAAQQLVDRVVLAESSMGEDLHISHLEGDLPQGLAEELFNQQLVLEGIGKLGEPPPKKGIVLNFRLISIIAAASIAILLLIRFWPNTSPKARSGQELFAAYYQFPSTGSLLAPVDDQNWKAAQEALDINDCEGFLSASKPILMNDSSTYFVPAIFLAGNCQLVAEEAEVALVLFQKVPRSSKQFFEQSQWYTVLAYLQLENNSRAKELLIPIEQDSQHYFHTEAVELMKELE